MTDRGKEIAEEFKDAKPEPDLQDLIAALRKGSYESWSTDYATDAADALEACQRNHGDVEKRYENAKESREEWEILAYETRGYLDEARSELASVKEALSEAGFSPLFLNEAIQHIIHRAEAAESKVQTFRAALEIVAEHETDDGCGTMREIARGALDSLSADVVTYRSDAEPQT